MIYNSISELAQFLVNSVHSDRIDSFEEYGKTEEDAELERSVESKKAQFVSSVTNSMASINDISKIVVQRKYSVWGEGVELVPQNDWELRELAEAAISTSGAKQKEALKGLLDYIRTSTTNRCCGNFGEKYDIFRYAWNGDDNDLLELAKKICSDECHETCKGIEHNEIDIVKGTVESYAEYDLNSCLAEIYD